MPLEKPKEPPDFYDLLNLRADATDMEIDLGFKGAAFRYHPDRYDTPKDKEAANEWMTYVNAARETLKDPVKRAVYDKTRGSRKRSPHDDSPPPPPRKKPVIKVDQTAISVEAVQGQEIRASFVVRHTSGELPPKWELVVERDGKLIDAAAVIGMDPPRSSLRNRFRTTITVTLPPQPKGTFEGSLEVYVEEVA